VAKEDFAAVFPGAAEVAEGFRYLQAHTYLGSDSHAEIALANKIAGKQPSKLSTWARVNLPVQGPMVGCSGVSSRLEEKETVHAQLLIRKKYEQ
jgi:hypothetical protein